MDRRRILELAIEELARRRKELDHEIEMVQAEMGAPTAAIAESKPATAGIRNRRPRTTAQREAQSRKMREYWAAKRSRTAERRKAQSLKMKAAWRKRRERSETDSKIGSKARSTKRHS